MSVEKMIVGTICIALLLSLVSPIITGNQLSEHKADIIKVVVITMLAKVPFERKSDE
jgi:ribose/xylose/arabinose/galactoside ABC-type transport system permease subunit